MYKRLPAPEKLDLIKRILAGEKVSLISREVGVSRTIIYSWLAKYKKTGSRGKKNILKTKTPKGRSDWKKIDNAAKIKIRSFALKHPASSPQQIANHAGISSAGVWKVLKEHGLNTKELRKQHRAIHGDTLVKPNSYVDKAAMLNRFEAGEKVSDLCRQFNVSRTVFYKWLKKYKSTKQLMSVEVARPKGDNHYRYIPGSRALIIQIVQEHPLLSPDTIGRQILEQTGKKLLSKDGIYRILKELNLNTKEKRVAYALLHASSRQVQAVAENSELPAAPRYSFTSSLSPPAAASNAAAAGSGRLASHGFFAPKKTLLFSSFVCIVGLLFLGLLATSIVQAPGIIAKIGMFFSVISLILGTFFLLYSLKYYLTIALVLSYSRGGNDAGEKGSFWSRLFGFELTMEVEGELKKPRMQESLGGMTSDLSHIKLERKPFISVHVSTYNEKRVIDRLLTAVTSFDYPNYEVIVADDSTDETVGLIEKWRHHARLKISHRDTRDGYKGQALQQALALTDKRAEFIAVFDADFIPYPDTLTQFLKYFQLTNGSLDFGQWERGEGKGERELNNSNIAAVQGYQWHVLNKSENWITRGVRSEYAGSYVIERSGTEIYQGLKQISGSVYMIRRDVLESIGWGRSITEDFQLSLKLYEQGFKVVYTPYIQAPAEAISTIKRLIRQRMRWSEGHSFNVKRMFARLLLGRFEAVVIPSPSTSLRVDCAEGSHTTQAAQMNEIPPRAQPALSRFGLSSRSNDLSNGLGRNDKMYWRPSPLTLTEKLEFLYLTPYYLQAAFFIIGTLCWFLAEVVFQVRLPFWTEVWGWSLVITNLFALPLMNMVGLFMEESSEKDYLGLFSFIALTYIVAPFQAYAAIKGFLEKEEGPWFRTPKTGRITDAFVPNRFYRFVRGILGNQAPQFQIQGSVGQANQSSYLALATAHNRFDDFAIRPKKSRLGNSILALFLCLTTILTSTAAFFPLPDAAYASDGVKTLTNAKKDEAAQQPKKEKEDLITKPRMVPKIVAGRDPLEIIYHKEPRVRIKFGKSELDIRTESIGGRRVSPTKALMKTKDSALYEDIIPGIDLRYSIKNGMLAEEFIIKNKAAAANLPQTLTQRVYTIGIDIKQTSLTEFKLIDKTDGKEKFAFDKPFLFDAKGKMRHDLQLTLKRERVGYTISKTLSGNAKSWLNDSSRAFPVTLDPSVVITGGITEAEAQRGGQRKVEFVNGNWYALYTDASTVFYKKSSDGVTWGSAVTISAVNIAFAPSLWVEGNLIYVTWLRDTGDAIAVNTINTASADALGTQCTSADLGTFGVANVTDAPSVAVADDGTVYVAVAGTSQAVVEKLTFSGCTFTNITTGSGLTTLDAPVVTTIGNNLHVVFQSGELSHSIYNGTSWINTGGQITELEALRGGQQRKIMYVNSNWYAFYTDQGTVFYKKSSDGVTWASAVTLDATSSPFGIAAWAEGTTIYVSWLRNTGDTIAVNTINTASADALGTQCNSASLTAFSTGVNDYSTLAVADDGTVYIALGGTVPTVEKLTFSGCTFTDITTGSGIKAASAPTITTIGNNLHMVFQEGELVHSIYNGTSWTAIGGAITENEARRGGPQRKIVYANSNWYAFYTDNATVFYKKSADGATWGSAVTLDSTNSPFAPTALVKGTTIYVGWLRDTGDNIVVNTIDTASADALGTQCTSADLGTFAPGSTTDDPALAVATDGTVYLANGGNTTATVQKLTFAGCTFTDITTGSGLTTIDLPTLNTIGNNLHMVYQDGNLSHSVYDGSSWTTSNVTVAAQGNTIFSTTTDGTSLWVLNNNGTAATFMYKCASCANTSPTWTTLTVPWTGQTNLNAVSLTYDSTNNKLYAFAIHDTTEQGYYKSTDATTISWSAETSFGFGGGGDLGQISSPEVGAGTSQIGVVIREREDYTFSTLTPTTSKVVDFSMVIADTDASYSLTTDGTNLWLLTVDTTTAAALYKCTSCASTSNWSTLTTPWTGQTNLTSVSLTYDSTNSKLYAFAIKDTTEQGYYKSSDATTISWSGETSFGFTGGDLGHISSPQEAAGTSQIGVTLREGPDYSFASLTPTTSKVVDFTLIISDTDAFYSLTTDGTNLWLLTVDSATAAALYKCTSCASSSNWSTLTTPWTAQTNLTSVTLTYDSTNTQLYAMVIKDTVEQAYWKNTDANTISWSADTSIGFTAGDLGHISSPATAAGPDKIAVLLRQGTNYEFSTVPENIWLLFLLFPLFQKLSKRRRIRSVQKLL